MSQAFLGVETSLSGRRWIGPDAARGRAAAALSQATGLPDHLTSLLARAEVGAPDAAGYLSPSLRDLMPDPSTIKDMDAATDLLLRHLEAKSPIAVFTDYDVDGAASAALLSDWISHHGPRPRIYIPDRIDEGYGPNTAAMEMLAADHKLIICTDCGTLSHEPIAAAKAAGADVIVLDHHLGGETLPDAIVVNPNRQDETTEHTYLCAAGVVFLLLVSLNRALRSEGKATPDILPFLDVTALATVADVAPLIGLNRAFVRQGLKVLSQRARPGLAALCDVAGLNSMPTAYHLGFLLGPRINAGGRIGDAGLGARLLTTQDPHEAEAIAQRLHALNAERRDIEAQVLLQATEQAEARGVDGALVWAAGDNWHPGVVGIVASRLKEMFNRPAVVIGLGAEEGKGSGRSIRGVDLGASVATCAREGLLLRGGGHKMAAGLSVSADKVEAAMTRLEELLARQGAAERGPRDLQLDGLLTPAAATPDLISEIEQAGPFGASAPAPRHAFAALRVAYSKPVGDGHLSLSLSADGANMKAIAFKVRGTSLGDALEQSGGMPMHVAGRLELDDWGGRVSAKLKLEDAAPAS